MKLKVLVPVFLIITVVSLAGCGKKNKNELGKIDIQAEKLDDKGRLGFLMGDNEIDGNFNIYDKNHFNSSTYDKNIDLSNVKEGDLVIGKGYFISDKDVDKFIEKEIKYIKNDIVGFMNTYHHLVSSGKNFDLDVKLDNEGNLLLNFKGFSPMSYTNNNKGFVEKYVNDCRGVSDIQFKSGGELKVLEGYYRTVKENFKNVKHVYFQLMGSPWELIANETHDGLLFMEPGEERPSKAPLSLFRMTNSNYNKETGFSNNYTGNRPISNSTSSVTSNYTGVNNSNNFSSDNQSNNSVSEPVKPEIKSEDIKEGKPLKEIEKDLSKEKVNVKPGDIIKEGGKELTPAEKEQMLKELKEEKTKP